MFDTNSIVVNDTAEIEIFHPITNKPTGMKVTIYGKDSAVFLEAKREQELAFLEDAKREPQLVAKEVGLKFISKCVVGWSGVGENGKELPFSVEALMDLCSKHRWLFEQIDRAIIQRKLFIKG